MPTTLTTRRHLLASTLVATATRATAGPATTERPNILFIYTDDHSYRTLSCYKEAYPWVRTPNFDRLAAEGVRFTACYNGAWCMPSRATMLTGHYQHAVESMSMKGTYPDSTYDPAKCPFWPKEWRKQGYFTAQIGKWHTGQDTGHGRDWDFQIVWNRPKYPDTSQNYYYHQPITYQGGKTEMLERYSTDQYTDWAIDLIQGNGRDKQKPWYLWLCYGAVHSPYQPAQRHLKELPGIDLDTPKDIFPPRPTKPDWAQKINQWNKDANGRPVSGKQSFVEAVRQYHQGVLALDEAVGRLLDTLEKTGQRKNTFIVFTSDQGLAFGQHGFKGVKIAAYDANVRSPLMFSMPGRVPQGKVCEAPVSGPDLVATMHKFAGIKPSWEMHGRDLTPLINNPNAKWDHPAMLVATGQTYGSDTNKIPVGEGAMHNQVPWYVMIRDRRYKYVRPLIHDLDELYDLQTDPDELNNLAQLPAHKARVMQMRAQMIAELRRTKCGFVDNMPALREA